MTTAGGIAYVSGRLGEPTRPSTKEGLKKRAESGSTSGCNANTRLDDGPNGDVDSGEQEIVRVRQVGYKWHTYESGQ